MAILNSLSEITSTVEEACAILFDAEESSVNVTVVTPTDVACTTPAVPAASDTDAADSLDEEKVGGTPVLIPPDACSWNEFPRSKCK
jgi:hypothetical protein